MVPGARFFFLSINNLCFLSTLYNLSLIVQFLEIILESL